MRSSSDERTVSLAPGVSVSHLSEAGEEDQPRTSYYISHETRRVVRTVHTRQGATSSTVELLPGAPREAHSAFDWCWLRQRERPAPCADTDPLTIVDMFSGCGQMSLGISEACRALGRRGNLLLAMDIFPPALTVCQRLYPDARFIGRRIERMLRGSLGAPPSAPERELQARTGKVDFLVGGPPCQGHSNLNNRSRRKDKRNPLGFRMIRAAELLKPNHVVIENVLGIKHDRGHVFTRMRSGLEQLGYRVAEAVVRAEEFGVPQRRHRTFLVGTLVPGVCPTYALSSPQIRPRSFSWACSRLRDSSSSVMDRAPVPMRQNQERIDYLFDHNLYDLPDAQRPPCHQNGTAYTSSYGRIRARKPVQTITTTFQVIGTGRFVHPNHRRPMTLREGARLQSIPDFVDFSEFSASVISQLIGNAVPPKVLYSIALRLLGGGI